MRRFTLVTIILLLLALVAAGIAQLVFFVEEDRPPVPAPTGSEME